MTTFSKCRTSIALFSSSVLLMLAGCGGGSSGDAAGGSGNVGGPPQSISGTVAKGAVLPNAKISMTCANGAVVSGVTGADGRYASSSVSIAYPCIGTALAAGGAPNYRGILFSGAVSNFSPLTDMLADAVLAAAASGPASLSIPEFTAKIAADPTFAVSASSPANVAAYRKVVLDTVRTVLVGSKTQAEIDAILAAAATFESTTFTANSALDQVLEATALFLQNLDGSVKAFILATIKFIANALAPPLSQPTGATGASGASGATGASGF